MLLQNREIGVVGWKIKMLFFLKNNASAEYFQIDYSKVIEINFYKKGENHV